MFRPYYILIGIRDSVRARTSLLVGTCIIAGVCLPMLLMLGLSRGLVEQFREDLSRSPSTRRIAVWATRDELRFDDQSETQLATNANVDVVIPDISGRAWFRNSSEPAGPPSQTDPDDVLVELSSTAVGDPMLLSHNVYLVDDRLKQVILTSTAAKSIGLPARLISDTTVQMRMNRTGDDSIYGINLTVSGIVPDGQQSAFLPRRLMDMLESFKRGQSVRELGLPGNQRDAEPRYDGYLLFTKAPLSERDMSDLAHRGLRANELVAGSESNNAARTLYGLLIDHELHVYALTANFDVEGKGSLVKIDPLEVERFTDSDDVVLPWTEPMKRVISGGNVTILGITLRRRWLKKYFQFYDAAMATNATNVDGPPNGLLVSDQTISAERSGPETIALPIDQSKTIEVSIRRLPNSQRSATPVQSSDITANDDSILVVPTTFAAHLARSLEGSLDYDAIQQRFVSPSETNRYSQAFVYASSIDAVPELDEQLQAMGYSTISSASRVTEMRHHLDTLAVLKQSMLVGVIALGILTLTVVYWDVARRRRGMIGVLRLCGVSPTGIITIMITRGLIVGLLGAALTVLVGYGLVGLISRLLNASCNITPGDQARVAVAAVACSILGILPSSIRTAFSVNPCDAISDARMD